MADGTFEPMSVGQILDGTFTLYRRNFVRFVAIVALIQVPIALASLVARVAVGSWTAAGTEDVEAPLQAAFLLSIVLVSLVGLFLSVVGQSLCSAALMKSVSESYLGNEVTVGQAYGAVLPKLLTLIFAGILVGLVVVAGMMVCVVPGVIFALWFAVTTPAILIENLGVAAGMGRSKWLTGGNLGKVFLVGLVAWLINVIAAGVITLPGTLAASVVARESWALRQVIGEPFYLAAQVLTTPIGATASILLYYDLRIRKEGFDLEMLAKSLASREAP